MKETSTSKRRKQTFYASGTARAKVSLDLEQVLPLSDAMKYCDVVVSGGVGNNVMGSFYLRSTDWESAWPEAYRMWRSGLQDAGLGELLTVSFEVLDERAMDEELARPKMPPLAGIGELAELLGVSRQRASVIARSKGFPEPLADLAAGPVFSKWAIKAFAERWDRKSGRPRKQPA